MNEQANEKKFAGEAAAEYVENGMTVGLGTGSTVKYTIEKLAERMNNEGLRFRGVPTSFQTERLAQSLGIPLVTLDEAIELDLTIDGADELDNRLNGIKGGGGALLREKIVASASKRTIWTAHAAKKVEKLGTFPLPVEIVPFAAAVVLRKLEGEGMRPEIRQVNGEPYETDNGNWIVDLHLGEIDDPEHLEQWLNLLPGVVENGLFLNRTDMAVIAEGSKVTVIKK
ncbi:MAG TPA: ribose-5-phosphate isomerase RpiA [Bacillales bacterium]|nr:ribose-5-phosphate isomerase RpiA [Bacillales bacterium]